jgi:hypothetical protein
MNCIVLLRYQPLHVSDTHVRMLAVLHCVLCAGALPWQGPDCFEWLPAAGHRLSRAAGVCARLLWSAVGPTAQHAEPVQQGGRYSSPACCRCAVSVKLSISCATAVTAHLQDDHQTHWRLRVVALEATGQLWWLKVAICVYRFAGRSTCERGGWL